jgi:hypothetical protein
VLSATALAAQALLANPSSETLTKAFMAALNADPRMTVAIKNIALPLDQMGQISIAFGNEGAVVTQAMNAVFAANVLTFATQVLATPTRDAANNFWDAWLRWVFSDQRGAYFRSFDVFKSVPDASGTAILTSVFGASATSGTLFKAFPLTVALRSTTVAVPQVIPQQPAQITNVTPVPSNSTVVAATVQATTTSVPPATSPVLATTVQATPTPVAATVTTVTAPQTIAVAVPPSVQGQYVKVCSDVVQCMNLSALAVYAVVPTPTGYTMTGDLAINKMGTMSSAWDQATTFGSLVDGNENTIAHTSCNDKPWMMLNLTATAAIGKISILNRKDCCQQRAVGLYVQILDSNMQVKYTSQKFPDKSGNTTFNENAPAYNSYMQFDMLPPSTTVAPSKPIPVPPPVDCQMGAWSDWNTCDWRTGKQNRTRGIAVQPAYGGKSCDGQETSQTQACTPNFPGLNNQKLALADNSGFNVDCPGSCNTASGQQLQQWGNDTNDLWTLGADGTIKSGGVCLDVRNSATANGGVVQVWGCNGSNAQKWRPVWNGTGFQLQNSNSQKCLDVQNTRGNGTKLYIWDCQNGNFNQLFGPA